MSQYVKELEQRTDVVYSITESETRWGRQAMAAIVRSWLRYRTASRSERDEDAVCAIAAKAQNESRVLVPLATARGSVTGRASKSLCWLLTPNSRCSPLIITAWLS